MNIVRVHDAGGNIRKKSRPLWTTAIAMAFLLVFGAAGGLAAESSGAFGGGGYSGPGPATVTVKQAREMRDDTTVAIRGNIVQSLGGEEYLFRDSTGTITIEVSDKRWQGRNIGPEDIVEIQGEVDRDWGRITIDVVRIITR